MLNFKPAKDVWWDFFYPLHNLGSRIQLFGKVSKSLTLEKKDFQPLDIFLFPLQNFTFYPKDIR